MIKIAINGFGRIGRTAFRRVVSHHPDLDVVAVNDLTDAKALAYLLKNDSVYGVYDQQVTVRGGDLVVGQKRIMVLSESEPAKAPWQELGVDVVLECTGRFTDLKEASQHLKAGARKVIISSNSKAETVPHFVLGVNEKDYDSEKDDVVAACSCTTNCAAPVVKIIDDNFNILRAQMSTIHAVTTNQNLLDGPHKDWRRARAAFANIIPTTTGAAKAVIRVLPELKGRISASALRVPVVCGSILEIVAQTDKRTTKEMVNQVFKSQARGGLKGILGVSSGQLVSSDIVGSSFSAIVDLPLTEVLENNLVKVSAWYDNEYGYACRLVELAKFIAERSF